MYNSLAMLSYSNTVYLIGNGSVHKEQFLSVYEPNAPLVAADGGANHLVQWDITPNAIIGDLDSMDDRSFWESQTKVIHIPDQDSTDFEKCAIYVLAPLYLCFGFCGSRY